MLESEKMIDEAQSKVDELFKQIEEIQLHLGKNLEKLYDEQGEGQFNMDLSEYFGLGQLNIGEEAFYFIPNNEDFEYEGDPWYRGRWIPSSETC